MYVFIFLGKKDNFGVFEEIFGDFWDCDDYVPENCDRGKERVLRTKYYKGLSLEL